MGLLVLTDAAASLRRRAWAIGALLAGAAAVELWPFYSTWSVTLGTSGGQAESWVERAEVETISRAKRLYWGNRFYQPHELLICLGPALLGIPVLAYLLLRGRQWFIVLGAAIMAVPYFLELVVDIPLGHRFLFFSVFYVHLAIVWLLLKGLASRRADTGRLDWRGRSAVAFLAVLLIWNVALKVGELTGHSLESSLQVRDFNAIEHYPPAYMTALERHAGEESVIMAPDYLAWPVGTYAPRVVSLLHPNPMVADRARRGRDRQRFFDPETTPAERREIIARYGVTHVFYDPTRLEPAVQEAVDGMAVRTVGLCELQLAELR